MVGRVFLGQYEVVRPLGEGGMGKVYLARRKSNGQQVVVKVMHDELAADPKFRALFEKEMQFMARLKHPHIVELYDASTRDAQGLCIVMEYVEGTDLEHLLKRNRRFPVERVGRWVGQLCSALQTAHAHGIIHRDLKPANIMVVDAGTPNEIIKVMDFGLAKLSGSVHISLDKLKGADVTIATGTPEYMAPEQVRGDELDHRSDLYSVGVILFELLTGRLPFVRPDIQSLLRAHEETPAPTFAAVGAGGVVSQQIEAVVQRCLCKFAVERFKDAWELGQAFEKALGMKILEGPPPPPPKAAVSPPTAVKKPVDPYATVFELDAWMPERIAVVKLKGYVDDMGGEATESEVGKIRVQFGQPGCKYQMPGAVKTPVKSGGISSWFGFGASAPKVPSRLIDLELLMEKKDDPRGSVLHLTVLIRPQDGKPPPASPEWKDLCNQIFKDLRAYLITK